MTRSIFGAVLVLGLLGTACGSSAGVAPPPPPVPTLEDCQKDSSVPCPGTEFDGVHAAREDPGLGDHLADAWSWTKQKVGMSGGSWSFGRISLWGLLGLAILLLTSWGLWELLRLIKNEMLDGHGWFIQCWLQLVGPLLVSSAVGIVLALLPGPSWTCGVAGILLGAWCTFRTPWPAVMPRPPAPPAVPPPPPNTPWPAWTHLEARRPLLRLICLIGGILVPLFL